MQREQLERELRERKPRPVHWREDDDSDEEAEEAELERKENAEREKAARALAGWGKGIVGVELMGPANGAAGPGGDFNAALAPGHSRASSVAAHPALPPRAASTIWMAGSGAGGVQVGGGSDILRTVPQFNANSSVERTNSTVTFGAVQHAGERKSLVAKGSVAHSIVDVGAAGGLQQSTAAPAGITSSLSGRQRRLIPLHQPPANPPLTDEQTLPIAENRNAL